MLLHVGMCVCSCLYILWYAYSPEADLLLKPLCDINAMMQENEIASNLICFSFVAAYSFVCFVWMLGVTLFDGFVDKFFARFYEDNE